MKTKLQFLYTNGKLFTCTPHDICIHEEYVEYLYTGPSHSIVSVRVPIEELAAVKWVALTPLKHKQVTTTVFKPKCYSKLFKAGKSFK